MFVDLKCYDLLPLKIPFNSVQTLSHPTSNLSCRAIRAACPIDHNSKDTKLGTSQSSESERNDAPRSGIAERNSVAEKD